MTPKQQGSWAAQAASSTANAGPVAAGPRAVPRRLGTEACADIMHRYAAGETANTLANEYGVARNSVLNLLRDRNVVVRRQPPSAEQTAQLVRVYESGATIAELVERTPHSYGAIRRALMQTGVQMRPRGFQPKG